MAQEPSEPVKPDFDKLREQLAKDRLAHYPTLARLEEPRDRVYVTTITAEDGKLIGKVRFRKWKHGEVGYFAKVPFYYKIANNLELTPEEKIRLDALKAEVVQLGILDKNRWAEMSSDQRFVDTMFYNMQYLSMMDKKSADDIDAFLNDDRGFMYGFIWFYMMRMTPSQVAELSESDVMAVTSWFGKWFQRLQENKT